MHGKNGPVSVASFLNSSELPLPLFDDSPDTNSVFHLRRLDEFIKFKGIPAELQLAVAYRLVTGQMSKQWVKAVSRDLTDYEAFKRAFFNTWWSPTKQSFIKWHLHQTKHNCQSNLSLSGHFLKYVTMASYLEPCPSDVELIKVIISHYPIGIQRALLAGQLTTNGQALDLLKRLEILEAGEGFQRPHNPPQSHHPNSPRQNSHPVRNDYRGQTQHQVRQIQYPHHRNRNNGNRRYGNYNSDRSRESQGESFGHLNPNVPPFQGLQEKVQPTPTSDRSES
jgi:hypothetical protein